MQAMKSILLHLYDHKTLSRGEAKDILLDIGAGAYSPVQISAFLSVFQMRHITVDELTGFRDALLNLCLPVDLQAYSPMDLCGTGGDARDTFNISTLSSFVVAGAGIKVAKHGNYGVSSICGSSNVMEHFGYAFTNDVVKLERQIAECGICFLHAPFFHPAMKYVAPVRKELGIKTFFNMLGPLVNPSQPRLQLVGVYSLELARMYNYLYQQEHKSYVILHALDGYDEISLTGPFKMISNAGEDILSPADLGLPVIAAAKLHGGTTIAEAASIFERVLHHQGTPEQHDVVCANAGMAIQCARPELTRADAIATAKESLISGNAYRVFQKLLAA